jgi:queuine tRNA-ribosyltransferase
MCVRDEPQWREFFFFFFFFFFFSRFFQFFSNFTPPRFRSYRDGSVINLTPETSVAYQKDIGADVILPLDQLLAAGDDATGRPGGASAESHDAALRCFERTHRWMERSLVAHRADPRGQIMYGIVHGGTDLALRVESARRLVTLGFDGLAIGGSLGTDAGEVASVVAAVRDWLDGEGLGATVPIHVLGIGDPTTARSCILAGADTMDSAYPTKVARHGTVFQRAGPPLQLRRVAFARDFGPLDPDCACPTCTVHTRAYVHHLIRSREPTAMGLLAAHNLWHMRVTFAAARDAILAGEPEAEA